MCRARLLCRARLSSLPRGLLCCAVILAVMGSIADAQSPKYGVGRPPSAEEIKAWDISVFPDGTGLPEGSGTAAQGKDVYERRCAECHGNNGEGGEQGALVGGVGSLDSAKPVKTVVSYWPYATTLWDYTNRSMPFDTPGVLTNDQVYAVVAYVLFLGGVVGENDVLDAKTLPRVKMPNRDGFVADDRPDAGAAKRVSAANQVAAKKE
jgi:mono/diheme cytochrome c family protein